ncbi:MAG: DUF3800 domain-containing protein [Candidatus Hatepunaea meridiana]|nr:DUF3800 domain-containing protein [Candidatus Hatepunaea meridiana]
MKYRIYIDETGNPDLNSSDNPNHRFLCLTGVIFELEYVRSVVNPEIESLKIKYFRSHPDEPVILHRKEILKAQRPFGALRDEKIRRKFDRDLLNALKKWEYSVISICIDKKKHKETYRTWRYDPYHYCLAVMLERFVFFLNRNNYKGDVLAESRGGKEDKRLKDAFIRLWNNGTDYVNPEQFQNALTSKELKIKLKANNITGLQIADLLALPSRNEILNENNLLMGKEIAPFSKKIIHLLQGKYDRYNERLFGKKLL